MHSFKPFIAASAALFATAYATTTFDPLASNNIAMYWGQGPDQGPLADVCANPNIDIVMISFIDVFPDQGPGGWPGDNFGNACGGSSYNNLQGVQTGLLSYCPEIGPDIITCQSLGTKVMLSIGGGYPTDYWIDNATSAINFADFLWGAFGPQTQEWVDAGMPRPFGEACVDGFDFDIESNLYGAIPDDANGNPIPDYQSRGYADMITEFQTLFAATGNKYYISGAPQCIIPDAHLAPAIQNSWFDFLYVQFYNTPQCSARAGINYTEGIGTDNISFEQWTQVTSLNPDVKIYLGLPAAPSAASGGPEYYLTPSEVYELASQYYSNTNFGGIMLWEATYSQNNLICGQEYASWMKTVLDSCPGGSFNSACPSSSSSSSVASSTTSSVSSSSSSIVITTSSTVSSSSSVVSSSSSSSTPPSSSSWPTVTSSSSAPSVVSSQSSSVPSSSPSSSPAGPTITSSTSSSTSCSETSSSSTASTSSPSSSPAGPTVTSSTSSSTTYSETSPSSTPSTWSSSSSPAGPTVISSASSSTPYSETSSSSAPSIWSSSSSPAGPTVTSSVVSSSSSPVGPTASSSSTSCSETSSSSAVSSSSSPASPVLSSTASSSVYSSPSVISSSSTPVSPVISSTSSSVPYQNGTSSSVPASSSSSSPVAPTTSSSAIWTTSTIYSTTVVTVTSCGPEVTNCPAHPEHQTSTTVITSVIAISTTVCPVTESSTPASPVVSSTSSPAPVTSVWTTSTVYSTHVITITACPPGTPNCPAEQQTTTAFTTVVPVSSTAYPVTGASSPAGGAAGARPSSYSTTTEVVSTMSVIPVPASQYYSSVSAAHSSAAGAVASSVGGGKVAVPSSSAVKGVYGSGNGTATFAPTGGYSKTSAAPVVQYTGAAARVGGQGVALVAMLGGFVAVLM